MSITRTTCRFCSSRNIALVLDLGEFALAGAFVKPEQFASERRYPLQLYFCKDCFLLQVVNVIPPQELFSTYFYQSSAINTLRQHFENLAKEIVEQWALRPSALVVEIGSNDGVLLEPIAKHGVRVLGVEPARNLAEASRNKGLEIENRFFTEEASAQIRQQHGAASVILANNVFAHIDDMHDVLRGIAELLEPEGVFITENHYLGSIIDEYQYDMIYHEHLSYYSLLALESFLSNFGLSVVDIKPIPIHAGSIRYYIRRQGYPVNKVVHELRESELRKGYDRLATFSAYANDVAERKRELLKLLQRIAQDGKKVAGYGASGRANTIIQYCQIDHSLMKYMIDDAPSKQGYYTPGSHFLVSSREVITAERPDYLLLFAWAFAEEIKQRNRSFLSEGGRMIVPLPYPRMLD